MIDNDGFPTYAPGDILTIKSQDQKRMQWQNIAFCRGYKNTEGMFTDLIDKHHGDRVKIAEDLGIDPGKEKRRLYAMVSIISQHGLRLKLKPQKKIRTLKESATAPGMTPDEYADKMENLDQLSAPMMAIGGSFEVTTSVRYDRCGYARAGG